MSRLRFRKALRPTGLPGRRNRRSHCVGRARALRAGRCGVRWSPKHEVGCAPTARWPPGTHARRSTRRAQILRHGSNIGRLQRPARSARSASRNRCGYFATGACGRRAHDRARGATARNASVGFWAMASRRPRSAFGRWQAGGHDRDAVARAIVNAPCDVGCASRNAQMRVTRCRPRNFMQPGAV